MRDDTSKNEYDSWFDWEDEPDTVEETENYGLFPSDYAEFNYIRVVK